MQTDDGNTKPKPPKRQPDGVTRLFDGELVNARCTCPTSQCFACKNSRLVEVTGWPAIHPRPFGRS